MKPNRTTIIPPLANIKPKIFVLPRLLLPIEEKASVLQLSVTFGVFKKNALAHSVGAEAEPEAAAGVEAGVEAAEPEVEEVEEPETLPEDVAQQELEVEVDEAGAAVHRHPAEVAVVHHHARQAHGLVVAVLFLKMHETISDCPLHL